MLIGRILHQYVVPGAETWRPHHLDNWQGSVHWIVHARRLFALVQPIFAIIRFDWVDFFWRRNHFCPWHRLL